jgi:hypothetical protein
MASKRLRLAFAGYRTADTEPTQRSRVITLLASATAHECQACDRAEVGALIALAARSAARPCIAPAWLTAPRNLRGMGK